MKTLLIYSFIFAPFLMFVEKYIWNDWQFALTMALLVAIDTITGMIFAWQSGTFSSKKMGSIGTKLIIYGLSLATIHMVSNHAVKGNPNDITAWIVPYFDSAVYAFFVMRELLSINENCTKLGYQILPKFIIKKFNDFDSETGAFEKPQPPTQAQ